MKKKVVPEIDEFYVGYLPEAPGNTATFVQKVVIGIGTLILVVIVLLVLSQKPFSNSVFNYEKLSTREGFLFKGPVPHLKVPLKDETGKFRTILLVGFGKAGADKTLAGFEKTLGVLDGKLVRLNGYLIQGNGKSLMQLEEKSPPLVLDSVFAGTIQTSLTPKGDVSLSGEIVDPKCFFGVMKPAEGKPHRSCAIRCIAGGIPPVLRTNTSDFVLLLGDDFQPVNQQVLSMVGDQIEISGQLVQFDDWKIILIKRDQLASISNMAQLARNLMVMEQGITLCQNK